MHYIGLASDLRGRIKQHLKDKHKGKWDRFSLYIIRKEDHIREVEALLTRIAEPAGNTQKGKLERSANLLPRLKREIKRKQDEEREALFEHFQRQARKVRTAKTQTKRTKKKTDRPLKGFFPTGKVIYATYKGAAFKAWVYRNGRIKYHGSIYDTPTAAAKTIVNRKTVNGWTFWKFKNADGELNKLKMLRK